MKKPTNDKELEELLKSIGRTPEQIEGIKDFGKLAKALGGKEEEFNETVKALEIKYELKRSPAKHWRW